MIEYENLRKSNQIFFDDFCESFDEFLESGWFVLGKKVSEFENSFSKFCNTNYCVGVASGLDALILAINAFDFPVGSEILVPSNTYIATIMAIVKNGYVPVLVEPDLKTYNIDAKKIEEKVNKNTVAVLIVHLYGKACNMKAIQSISEHFNLKLIEDCAQSHGAKFNGKMTGSFGVGCFSFYPTKNLGALGDAGAITCNTEKFSQRIQSLRNYGSSKKYHNDELGYNSRLDEIQAGFLSKKLRMLDDITCHKRKLAELYLLNLNDSYVKPVVEEGYHDVYHIFNIRHKKRDALKEHLLKNKIGSEIHYPVPPHKQQCLSSIIKGEYPISEEIHNTTLSLPISFFHDASDILKICDVMNSWTGQ
jgi:dTDP-4-amino-4,6-dideoxygalactose transaminase